MVILVLSFVYQLMCASRLLAHGYSIAELNSAVVECARVKYERVVSADSYGRGSNSCRQNAANDPYPNATVSQHRGGPFSCLQESMA